MNVAFVASTLPAAFIHKYASRLGINKVMCATTDLLDSYTFLVETHSDLRVEALPKGKLGHFFSVLYNILSCEKVYFSHECCWPLFDLALIITRAQSVWFPQSSMNGFRLVCPAELTFLAQLKFYYRNQKKFRPVQATMKTFVKRWFNVYETNCDGGEGLFQCLSLKTDRFSFIERLDVTKLADSNSQTHEENLKTHKVLIVCAREPIDDAVQKKLYLEVSGIFARNGYRIFVKDHPNKAGRLGFVYPGSQIIPAHIPIECVDTKFDFLIGVASTSLTRLNTKALSLLKLLPFPEAVLQSRLSTLSALDNSQDIIFLQSVEEINEIINS